MKKVIIAILFLGVFLLPPFVFAKKQNKTNVIQTQNYSNLNNFSNKESNITTIKKARQEKKKATIKARQEKRKAAIKARQEKRKKAAKNVKTDTDKITSDEYIWHNNVLTTQFYIGERGSKNQTAWNINAVKSFGCVDDPINRDGIYPANCAPKENSFYFALPYDDLTNSGIRRNSAKDIPWYNSSLDIEGYSFVKNKWIEIKKGDFVCYAQWEDCIPIDNTGECFDNNYVFGNENTIVEIGVGLDVSPAVSDCLGMDDPTDKKFGHMDGYTSWKFIDEKDVPNGLWKTTITNSNINW